MTRREVFGALVLGMLFCFGSLTVFCQEGGGPCPDEEPGKKWNESLDWFPIQASMWPGYAAPPRLRGVYGLRLGLPSSGETPEVYGVDLGLLTSGTCAAFGGVQLYPVNLNKTGAYGVQFAFANVTGSEDKDDGEVVGLQFGLLNKTRGDSLAFQYAVVNDNRGLWRTETAGSQNGAVNLAEKSMGANFGFVNIHELIQGLDFGLVNVAEKTEGVQFGLVNVTDDVEGCQIGLVNITINSDMPFVPFLNF